MLINYDMREAEIESKFLIARRIYPLWEQSPRYSRCHCWLSFSNNKPQFASRDFSYDFPEDCKCLKPLTGGLIAGFWKRSSDCLNIESRV